MNSIKDRIKKMGFVRKLRSEKWKRLARKELFSINEVKRLERNPEKKTIAIRHRLEKLPDHGKKIVEELEAVYSASPMPKRTDIDAATVKEDMLFWHFAYGFTFNEYACYQFIDKKPEERRTFLSDRDSAWICYDLNDIEDMIILADKAKTYVRFKKYYKRDALIISCQADFPRFCRFIEKHHRFIKKNTLESCGRGIEIIDLHNRKDTPQELFYRWIAEGRIILEEIVEQSKSLGAFNETSVNTLRCTTFRTKEGIVPFFFMFKTGRKGMIVDNGAAGGLFIAVDGETGVLGQATDESGNRFNAHPDSGMKYVGFQLPDFKQAIQMCCEMSAQLPSLRIIGWDLAHTDNGWVVIEGNSMTEAIGPQCTWLKGIRKRTDELYTMI